LPSLARARYDAVRRVCSPHNDETVMTHTSPTGLRIWRSAHARPRERYFQQPSHQAIRSSLGSRWESTLERASTTHTTVPKSRNSDARASVPAALFREETWSLVPVQAVHCTPDTAATALLWSTSNKCLRRDGWLYQARGSYKPR
jgi:hypothetical protein